MKTSRIIVAVLAMTAGTSLLRALDNEDARRERLKELRGAIRAFGVLYPGKAPDKLSQLVDDNLVDGPGALVRLGATAVPPRAELDAHADYTMEPLAGIADMVIREKEPLRGETEILAIFSDGTIKALAVSLASASAPGSPTAPAAPAVPPAGPAPAGRNDAPATSAALPVPVVNPGPRATAPTPRVEALTLPPVEVAPAAILQAANSVFAQGNAAEARPLFAQAVQAQPGSADALVGLARCQNALGEIDAAIATYERVQRTSPALPNLRTWLAELKVAKGDLPAARRLLEDELRENPASAWALSWLGTVELQSSNATAAQSLFRRAVQLDPNIVDFRYRNAGWMGQNNQPARAALDAIAVITMQPAHAGAYYAAGDSFARLGQRDAAVQYFRRYLQFDASSEWAARARQEIQRLGR